MIVIGEENKGMAEVEGGGREGVGPAARGRVHAMSPRLNSRHQDGKAGPWGGAFIYIYIYIFISV